MVIFLIQELVTIRYLANMKDNIITCIVLGGSTNALGQIRAIHELGYKCINIVEKGAHDWSSKSRLCEGIVSPHPFTHKEEVLDLLHSIINQQKTRPFIFFASDDWMDLIGENEEDFRKKAFIPQSPWNKLSKLYNKKYLYRIAEENGIPYPITLEFTSLKGISGRDLNMTPPYIVKPQETVSQNLLNEKGIHSYHRTQKFDTKEELDKWINRLLANEIDMPVLIQEFIPGDATTLYTLTSYSNEDGRMLAGSVGHKLRQFPPEAGRITSGVLENNVTVYEIGQRFLSVVGYHGLANTEFKYDLRDGKYKLMEINTRLGAWNYSTLYSGLNLIDIAIKDTLGITYEGPTSSTKNDGAIWYNIIYDLPAAIYLNRKFDKGEFKLSFQQWRESLKKKSFEAVWSWRDPIPFVCYLWNMGKKVVKGLS